MSINWYLACHECKTILNVAEDGFSGFTFYSAEKSCMKALRDMLNVCKFHPGMISFVMEQGIEWDDYHHIKWKCNDNLPPFRP